MPIGNTGNIKILADKVGTLETEAGVLKAELLKVDSERLSYEAAGVPLTTEQIAARISGIGFGRIQAAVTAATDTFSDSDIVTPPGE